MRKIRVLGILTHFKLKKDASGKEKCIIGGVDYARVIQPLEHLDKDKFEVDIVYEPISPSGRFKTVDELTQYYDICYFSYIDSVPFYIQLKVWGIRNNMKMILDLDDNIWDVDPSHPSYKDGFEPTSEKQFNRTAIILDVDGITTTSKFLKYKIAERTRRPLSSISVMPNYIDLTKYDFKKIPVMKKSDEITIGYIGGSSHFPDMNKPEFTNAMTKIMDKYPNVRFKTTFFMPQLKALWGYKYQYAMGRKDVYKFIYELWPEMMSGCDFFVAPLSWSKYSRSKSYIKYLEYSAGKKASIMEDIDPYQEVLRYSEDRGLLASSTDNWVKHISFLIENSKERDKMGLNAYKYTKDNHTIQKNADIYEKYLISIDKQKITTKL
jgi:glycosyltransferase involved in cell wall biosynthesis